MKMNKRVPCLTTLVLISFCFALAFPAHGQEERTIRIAMGYIPNVQFAPWYVAEAKGFFAREGLHVGMDYRMDSDGLVLVGQGRMEFAIGGGDMVLIARANGVPVTYICTLYAKFPPSIVSLKASGLKSMRDLKGKRIGYPAMGTSYIALRAMLAKSGMRVDDVKAVAVGYTQIESLIGDKIDAAVVFTNNEPLQMSAQGLAFNEIHSYDYLPLVGHGVVAGDQLLRDRPELARAFVRATLDGMRYVQRYPKDAMKIVAKTINLPLKDQEVQYRVLLASVKLWENTYSRRHGLGSSDPKAWTESQRFMTEQGFIKEAVSIDKVMSNAYLK